MSGRGSYARSAEGRSIGSLAYAARIRNPLLQTGLDLRLFQAWYYDATGMTLNLIEIREFGPAANAWLAKSLGNYPRATELYRKVLKDKKAWPLRYDLAMTLYYTGQHDSAVVELQRYIEASRTEEKKEKDVVVFYEPKAMAEYTIGYIYFVMNRRDEARAAFGRALTEDLSFYPAHVALGEIARVSRDSATALQELQLAAELAPGDANVRYRFGRALHDAKRYDEAIREFGESTGLEPAYADSYYYLGLSSEAAGRKPEAISAYEAYLVRVSREVKHERLVAEGRLAELKKAP
jgi:tetratricopeptide (TPR) repeat protein